VIALFLNSRLMLQSQSEIQGQFERNAIVVLDKPYEIADKVVKTDRSRSCCRLSDIPAAWSPDSARLGVAVVPLACLNSDVYYSRTFSTTLAKFLGKHSLSSRRCANSNWRQATPLLMAVGHAAHFRVADQLLKAGVDPNQGTSILHASCAWHFEHLVPALRYLTESGWDVNSRDSSGQTALHKAAFLGYAKRQFEPSWSRAPIRMRRTHRG